MDVSEFKPGRGRKVAFWRNLALAEGLPPPHTPKEYARLYRRWRLYGYADSELGQLYVEKLQKIGYKMANRDKGHCVCGAPIKYRWLIVNHAGKLYAYIGNECKERFFLPPPTTPRMALKETIMILGNQIEETERVGLDTYFLELLLGDALRYAEKSTKYKEVYVSKWFAKNLELHVGIRWKWKTWEDVNKAKAR